jgi:hypothetical protein
MAAAQGDTVRTPADNPMAKVRDYELVDQQPGLFRYVHDKRDTIVVTVAPYPPGTVLGKSDDTAAYVFSSVDDFRKNFYARMTASSAAAVDQGTAPHNDPISVQGMMLHGDYTLLPYVNERVAGRRDLFYAIYPLPGGLVRFESRFPDYDRQMSRLLNFTHGFLDVLIRTARSQASAGQ